ncbi:MAG: CPBP family intramembrane metalloprotease [Clostridia bacterium]|nr:CPBP family intramembrane metalloprotease [Clostridia bacterium]
MKSSKGRLIVCWIGAVLCAALGWLSGSVAVQALLLRGGATLLMLYVLNAAQQLLIFALPALFLLQGRATRWQEFGESIRPLNKETVGWSALLAVGGSVAASIIASFWAIWLEQTTGYTGTADPLPVPQNAGQWIAALLAIAILPALCEELMFRALIQSALCRYLPRVGLWLAALVFAAAHFRWEAFPALLLIGAVLGKTYIRHGLLGSTLLHALYNSVVLILSARGAEISPMAALLCIAACIVSLRLLLRGEKKDETDSPGV